MVDPNIKVFGAFDVIRVLPQLSKAEGLPRVTVVPSQARLVLIVILEGQVIDGGSWSVMVIIWLHEELFPLGSLTTQVTTVVPIG